MNFPRTWKNFDDANSNTLALPLKMHRKIPARALLVQDV